MNKAEWLEMEQALQAEGMSMFPSPTSNALIYEYLETNKTPLEEKSEVFIYDPKLITPSQARKEFLAKQEALIEEMRQDVSIKKEILVVYEEKIKKILAELERISWRELSIPEMEMRIGSVLGQGDTSDIKFFLNEETGRYRIALTTDNTKRQEAMLATAKRMNIQITTNEEHEMEASKVATYHIHKFRCMACSLHFAVYSDYEQWPAEGTTRALNLGEATGLVYCPECGSTNSKVSWHEEIEGFIFQAIPGTARVGGIPEPGE